MMRYLVAYVFTLCFTLSGMDCSILICNKTKQPFEIKTTIVDDRTKRSFKTLCSTTSVSDVWYGGKTINDGEVILAATNKRLFVRVNNPAASSGAFRCPSGFSSLHATSGGEFNPERLLNLEDHVQHSDFIVLQNHEEYFYINFGYNSCGLKLPLPVVTTAVSTDVKARYTNVFGDNIRSQSGKYNAYHVSSRKDGGEVITITAVL